MSRFVVWMPTINLLLNPHVHGEYVEATEGNKKESQRRWKAHEPTTTAIDVRVSANR
jgi:hypothetical protein